MAVVAVMLMTKQLLSTTGILTFIIFFPFHPHQPCLKRTPYLVSYKKQKLFTNPEHHSSLPVLNGFRAFFCVCTFWFFNQHVLWFWCFRHCLSKDFPTLHISYFYFSVSSNKSSDLRNRRVLNNFYLILTSSYC